MELTNCPSCGGRLKVESFSKPVICEYCENTVAISKNTGAVQNRIERANMLRSNKEFDSARLVYEDILKEYPTDDVAAWGLVLTKYGVEYVKDPRSGKYIPTIHRLNFSSILEDFDYKTAIQFADENNRESYITQAKEINEIQKQALNQVNNFEKFDVFISYKDTDGNDNRTSDSYEAQNIYTRLLEENNELNVFYARSTLQRLASGIHYEPVIFSALHSSKVMILLGMKLEHFIAPWVKNEWSRFLDMSRRESSNSKKLFIVIGPQMSVSDLPFELQSIQVFQMRDSQWSLNLFSSLEKEFKTKTVNNNINPFTINQKVQEDQVLNEKGEGFLQIQKYPNALLVFEEFTSKYPANPKGWWGLIRSKTNDFNPAIVEDFNDTQINNLLEQFHSIKLLNSKNPINGFENMRNELSSFIINASEKIAKKNLSNAQTIISQVENAMDKEEKETEKEIEEMRSQILQNHDNIRNLNIEKQELLKERDKVNLKYNVQEKYNLIPKLLRIAAIVLLILPMFIAFSNEFVGGNKIIPLIGYGVALGAGKYFWEADKKLIAIVAFVAVQYLINAINQGDPTVFISGTSTFTLMAMGVNFLAKKLKRSKYSEESIATIDDRIAQIDNSIDQNNASTNQAENAINVLQSEIEEKLSKYKNDLYDLSQYAKTQPKNVTQYVFSKYSDILGVKVDVDDFIKNINSRFNLNI